MRSTWRPLDSTFEQKGAIVTVKICVLYDRRFSNQFEIVSDFFTTRSDAQVKKKPFNHSQACLNVGLSFDFISKICRKISSLSMCLRDSSQHFQAVNYFSSSSMRPQIIINPEMIHQLHPARKPVVPEPASKLNPAQKQSSRKHVESNLCFCWNVF